MLTAYAYNKVHAYMYVHVRCHVRRAFFELTVSQPVESTSAEPGRKVGYSRDVGWRVVWQKVDMGLTFEKLLQEYR